MLNSYMNYILISILSLLMVSCTTTKYVEKQSEELSRSVYAVKDSLDSARFDLAAKYSNESTRLVAPPKQRIKIESIVKTNSNNQTERVALLPQSNKKDKVILAESPEYLDLLKDERVLNQLKIDNDNLNLYSKEVDKQLTEQYKIQNDMVVKIQDLEKKILQKDKKLLQKDLAILWRNITIISLIGVMGVGVYLRMKGIL